MYKHDKTTSAIMRQNVREARHSIRSVQEAREFGTLDQELYTENAPADDSMELIEEANTTKAGKTKAGKTKAVKPKALDACANPRALRNQAAIALAAKAAKNKELDGLAVAKEAIDCLKNAGFDYKTSLKKAKAVGGSGLFLGLPSVFQQGLPNEERGVSWEVYEDREPAQPLVRRSLTHSLHSPTRSPTRCVLDDVTALAHALTHSLRARRRHCIHSFAHSQGIRPGDGCLVGFSAVLDHHGRS
jgi:hypothetical protein